MQELLDYEESDLDEVFGLTFQIMEEVFGQAQAVDLIHDGSKVNVNQDNKQQYVDSYVDYVLNTSVEEQFQAFSDGFHHVCGGRVLNFFHPQELMVMVVGDDNYDWDEFQESAQYKGEFYANHPTIRLFWTVFREMSLEEKKKFLVFLTGSDRVPMQGMKSLQPIFHSVKGGTDYFPVAHTCFNLLDLPLYTNKEELRKKLLMAIEHHEGFTIV